MSNTLVQLARRRAVVRDERTTAIDDLHGGRSVADTAARRGLPEVAVRGVRSFYDFLRIHDDGTPRPCVGTACAFAGGSAPPSAPPPSPVRASLRSRPSPGPT